MVRARGKSGSGKATYHSGLGSGAPLTSDQVMAMRAEEGSFSANEKIESFKNDANKPYNELQR